MHLRSFLLTEKENAHRGCLHIRISLLSAVVPKVVKVRPDYYLGSLRQYGAASFFDFSPASPSFTGKKQTRLGIFCKLPCGKLLKRCNANRTADHCIYIYIWHCYSPSLFLPLLIACLCEDFIRLHWQLVGIHNLRVLMPYTGFGAACSVAFHRESNIWIFWNIRLLAR